MFIQVNQELCAGCGVCMETCPVGAIQLVDQWAVIDDALYTQCEVCADACPNGAITALSIPARSTSIVALPAAESRMIPARDQAALPETAAPAAVWRRWPEPRWHFWGVKSLRVWPMC
ncbi:MAG: 4Fe-4S binding protein [Chloroflexota bacterium]